MAEAATAQRHWAHYTAPDFLDVGGLSTAYRRGGDGPALLYLHGAGMTRMWLPLYEALAESFDVVVPEHPGFGDTPLPDWLDDFTDLTLHYDAVLDRLGLEQVHLVGHSLGGWIAANLAIFYPHRFQTLTLITPAGLRHELPGEADSFRLTADEAPAVLLNDGHDAYAEYFVQEGMPGDMIHAYREGIAYAKLAWNPRYDHKLDHRLGRIQTPTLILKPDEDRLIPAEVADLWAARIAGARVEHVPGRDGDLTGHLMILQQPDAIAQRIAAHLAVTTR